MGRIKTKGVKVLADDLIKQNAGKFSTDFEKNKLALAELRPIKSKKIRNSLAGYISKKIQQAKAPRITKPEND